MLIFSHKLTPRLQYACAFIFVQHLGLEISYTGDIKYFEGYSGPKINYSTSDIRCSYTIKPVSLLFENYIKPQTIECFEKDGYKAFFQTENASLSFDLLAAVFYLLSRYEEYLPHTKDPYGRYAHENSVAFNNGFLQQPLINIWLLHLASGLKQAYPESVTREKNFSFLTTYDIDIAWSFKNKGFIRDIGGLLLAPSVKRLRVLWGKEKDPYDCYEFLDQLHQRFNLRPVYFFLVASIRGRYDKNNILNNKLKELIRGHSEKYSLGIHPSWKSNKLPALLAREKGYLEKLLPSNQAVTASRQHYIKFDLPETFSELLKAGILDDYSMGYGSINGFRASVASTFYWYNLAREEQTPLRLHPFCFMDANSFYEQRQSAEASYAELLYYFSVCKEVKGHLITVFHNNILGGSGAFEKWPGMYAHFLSVAAAYQENTLHL